LDFKRYEIKVQSAISNHFQSRISNAGLSNFKIPDLAFLGKV